MKYSVSLSDDKKYILITVNVDITVELAKKFSVEARDLGIKHNIDRFLFDMTDSPNVESTMRNYSYAYEDMPEMELNRNAKSAVLVDPADQSHSFVETVSKNAGYNVRIFIDKKSAIDWLYE